MNDFNISSLNLMVSSGVFVCLAALAAADVESPAPVQVAVGAQVAMMKPGFVSFNIDFDNRPSQLQVCSSPPTPQTPILWTVIYTLPPRVQCPTVSARCGSSRLNIMLIRCHIDESALSIYTICSQAFSQ